MRTQKIRFQFESYLNNPLFLAHDFVKIRRLLHFNNVLFKVTSLHVTALFYAPAENEVKFKEFQYQDDFSFTCFECNVCNVSCPGICI